MCVGGTAGDGSLVGMFSDVSGVNLTDGELMPDVAPTDERGDSSKMGRGIV